MAKDKEFPQAYHDFYKTSGVDCTYRNYDPSLTRQEFAEECDINVIMARYERTGMLPANTRQPMYIDFGAKPDNLMDMIALMEAAETSFMQLPAQVRREFENNAAMFVEFASDPANIDVLRAWGLAPMPEEPVTKPAGDVQAAAPAPAAAGSGAPQAAAPPQAPPGQHSST